MLLYDGTETVLATPLMRTLAGGSVEWLTVGGWSMLTERFHGSSHLGQVRHGARGSRHDQERRRRERRRQERTDAAACRVTLQPLGNGHSTADQQGQSTHHGQGLYLSLFYCPFESWFSILVFFFIFVAFSALTLLVWAAGRASGL